MFKPKDETEKKVVKKSSVFASKKFPPENGKDKKSDLIQGKVKKPKKAKKGKKPAPFRGEMAGMLTKTFSRVPSAEKY